MSRNAFILGAALIAAAIAVAAFAVQLSRGKVGDPDPMPGTIADADAAAPPGSFEWRIARAKSRIATGEAAKAVFHRVASDPIAAARAAAARGDYRLLVFQLFMPTARLPPPGFAGVRCAIPRSFAPLLTLAEWSIAVSDIAPFGPPPEPPFDGKAAEIYNLEMLRQPGFPDADLCVPDVTSGHLPDRDAPTAWSRLSPRPAQAADPALAFNLAVRNGADGQNAPAEIDTPDGFGMTALAWAAARAPREVVAALLAQGADPWFGDYCATRNFGGSYTSPMGENSAISPIFLAVARGRADVVSDMLDRVPRKTCTDHPMGHPSALLQRLSVVRDFGHVAKEAGMVDAHGRIVADYLEQIQTLPEDRYAAYAFEDLANYAWQNRLGELFKTRPIAEIAASRNFLRMVASNGSLEDLQYWVEKLRPGSPDALGSILSGIDYNERRDPDRSQFAAKLEYGLSLTRDFTAAEKFVIFRRVLGQGSLGSTGTDTDALRLLVRAYARNGYDLDTNLDSDGCTLLMQAVSYSRECQQTLYSPGLARALLEQGVEVNRRSRQGRTALDLARIRVANGPLKDEFRPIVATLESMGARPGEDGPDANAPHP